MPSEREQYAGQQDRSQSGQGLLFHDILSPIFQNRSMEKKGLPVEIGFSDALRAFKIIHRTDFRSLNFVALTFFLVYRDNLKSPEKGWYGGIHRGTETKDY
jgi:hypothetical protein